MEGAMKPGVINVAVAAAFACTSVSVAGQWLDRPAVGVPRGPTGAPDLSAPAPQTADGKPDLSGVWQPTPAPVVGGGGVEAMGVAPRYLFDVTRDMADREGLMTPWASEIYQRRAQNSWRDNPLIRCQPAGVPRLNAYTHPYKVVQSPSLIVILYESQTMFRQIFLDGRELPEDPQPSWMGYSVGRWEGDVLAVETTGFNGKAWLDGSGHPQSEAMRLSERFTRRTVGRMDIEVVIEDRQAYTRPIRYVQPQSFRTEGDLIEYVCTENPKEVFRQQPEAPEKSR
jgi:hypothetical protein